MRRGDVHEQQTVRAVRREDFPASLFDDTTVVVIVQSERPTARASGRPVPAPVR